MIETLLLMVFGVAAYGTLGWYMAGRPRRITTPMLVEDSLTERLREEQAQHEAELREFDRELRPELNSPISNLPGGTYAALDEAMKHAYTIGNSWVAYESDLQLAARGERRGKFGYKVTG